MNLIAILCMLVVSTLQAPVSVIKAKPRYGTHMECVAGGGCFDTGSVDMGIEYRNDSNKELTGVKFEVFFLDGVGDKHKSPTTYTASKKLAPGKTYTAKWENLANADAKGMEADVVKVLFKDGTTWEKPNWNNRDVSGGHPGPLC